MDFDHEIFDAQRSKSNVIEIVPETDSLVRSRFIEMNWDASSLSTDDALISLIPTVDITDFICGNFDFFRDLGSGRSVSSVLESPIEAYHWKVILCF